KKSSFYVYRKVNSIADRCFGRIHVATELRRNDGTPCFTTGRCNADTSEEGMQRNLHLEIGIVRPKRRGVRSVINVVKPDAFRQVGIEHGRVLARIDSSKTGSNCANAEIPAHLQIENLDCKRVSDLRALYVKRPGERIVAFGHAERVSRLL